MIVASGPPLGGHLVHALLLASWLPIFGLMALRDRLRRRKPANSASRTRGADARLTQTMAVGCVCAALIHGAVMPDHFAESWLYGGFFLAVATGQLLYAGALLVRPNRALVATGAIGSGLVVAFWLVSRLVGVPIGPDNGGTEPFGMLDIVASAVETLTLVAGLISLARTTAVPGWRLRSWTLGMRGLATFCIAGSVIASVIGPRS
jgi:hypothetical protein